MGQAILKERFENYCPRDVDMPDYDREEFEKKMEEEIMKITLNFSTYDPTHGMYLVAKKYRTECLCLMHSLALL